MGQNMERENLMEKLAFLRLNLMRQSEEEAQDLYNWASSEMTIVTQPGLTSKHTISRCTFSLIDQNRSKDNDNTNDQISWNQDDSQRICYTMKKRKLKKKSIPSSATIARQEETDIS